MHPGHVAGLVVHPDYLKHRTQGINVVVGIGHDHPVSIPGLDHHQAEILPEFHLLKGITIGCPLPLPLFIENGRITLTGFPVDLTPWIHHLHALEVDVVLGGNAVYLFVVPHQNGMSQPVIQHRLSALQGTKRTAVRQHHPPGIGLCLGADHAHHFIAVSQALLQLKSISVPIRNRLARHT